MAIEIEHKFLLANNDWRKQVYKSLHYQQGYLHSNANNSIRIRISNTDAWLNIKSATIGTQRNEYEYAIPLSDANEMLNNLCRKPLIKKTRHFVKFEEHIWEIDEFEDDNQGLIVAEVELSSLHEHFALPLWVGEEVTEDLRYYNNKLAITPYTTWDE
jgi:adenylate cyclase